LVAAAIGYTGYAVAVRIAPRRFFPIVEVALIAIAAGLLSRGVGTLQQVGWLPGYHSWAFDTGWWSGWWSVPGSVARQVFYVAPTPTVAQFAAWLAYLVVMLAVSLRSLGLPGAPPST
ncbi:MAG TPA: FTR1 family protein, partial [Mycobacterium sp.]|nr:FTR1 family protein [Mycobacterium sp.]